MIATDLQRDLSSLGYIILQYCKIWTLHKDCASLQVASAKSYQISLECNHARHTCPYHAPGGSLAPLLALAGLLAPSQIPDGTSTLVNHVQACPLYHAGSGGSCL